MTTEVAASDTSASVHLPPLSPHVIVLFGATGDLSRRKLLPGMLRLANAGLLTNFRIVGTSLDDLDDEGFRNHARSAVDECSRRRGDRETDAMGQLRRAVGPTCPRPTGSRSARADAVGKAEAALGSDARRLHYLSIPPVAAGAVVQMLAEAGFSALKNGRGSSWRSPSAPDLALARSVERRGPRRLR